MVPLICLFCKNYKWDGTCNAFLKKIPLEISNGFSDHSKPLPEQENDIVFEPIETE